MIAATVFRSLSNRTDSVGNAFAPSINAVDPGSISIMFSVRANRLREGSAWALFSMYPADFRYPTSESGEISSPSRSVLGAE